MERLWYYSIMSDIQVPTDKVSLLAIGNLEQRLFQVQIKCQGHFLLKYG